MDSQLKQRLVGAAVLVSLAILVVPILLDGGYQPAPSPRRDIAPMPADSFEETVPPLAQGVRESLDAGLEAAPDALSKAASEAAAALDTPPEVTPPAFTAEEAVEASPPVAQTPPAPATPAVQAPPPAPKPVPAAPTPTPKTEQWSVQLGSFASRANAEKLLGRVQATGVEGFILPLTEGGKTSFRVRAGPVASRAAADRLRQDLERTQAIRGMLVRYP
ncbi:MAG: SPOR domain-containing protein [Gammaproteobacteria bacterium]